MTTTTNPMRLRLSPHQLVPINAEMIRRLTPDCCYPDERLHEFLGDGCTALEVATRRGGKVRRTKKGGVQGGKKGRK